MSHFIRARGRQLRLADRPHAFLGVNLWYGAYLAADAPYGNLPRLRAELNQLAELGVTNLRVMGGTESGPMRRSITPAFRGPGTDYHEPLLRGLDRLLAELAAREMYAVICLTNFWEWSGGMGTYLSWVNGGQHVDMNDPAHPWPSYPEATARFYANREANGLYRDYVRSLVTRTNSVTGLTYNQDPTVMAWQLANEPRAGSSILPGHHVIPEFVRWVHETAGFIKSLTSEQLVSTGSEGLAGCVGDEDCLREAHASEHVNYLTVHIWPRNWGWLEDENMSLGYADAEQKTREYLKRHLAVAEALDKPLVLEEFGLCRDQGALLPGTPTTVRDRYFRFLFGEVEASLARGGPLFGSNVWSWGGQGRAEHEDGLFRRGDSSFTGDPPQEPQGLNSIFDCDGSTIDVIRGHARTLSALTESGCHAVGKP